MKKIPLTQNKYAIVDDEDYEFLSKWKWHANKSGKNYYARRNLNLSSGTRTCLEMHRQINNTPPGQITDHINRDSLDNRKCNLRTVCRSRNIQNSSEKIGVSGLRGVSWNIANNKWAARICYKAKREFLGLFDNKEDAAIAYNEASRKIYGNGGFINKLEK